MIIVEPKQQQYVPGEFILGCFFMHQTERYWSHYFIFIDNINTIGSHNNAVQYNMIFHAALQWLKHSWWRHQMETFSALLAFCAGNSPINGEFPTQRPVTWSFDISFDLLLNKRLSKQSWGWWFETPSCPLWRHCNDINQEFVCTKDTPYLTLTGQLCGVGNEDFQENLLHYSGIELYWSEVCHTDKQRLDVGHQYGEVIARLL